MIKNAKLKNLFKLSCKVTVYVPATTGINKPIDNQPYVERIASLMSDLFGGATSTNALGFWNSATAGLVQEKTTIVFAYCKQDDLERKLDKVIEACEQMRTELTQDAIALEVNGEMYFV